MAALALMTPGFALPEANHKGAVACDMKIPQGKFFAGFLRSGFHLTAKFLGPAGARPAAGHLACHGRAEAQRDNPGAYAHSQPQRNNERYGKVRGNKPLPGKFPGCSPPAAKRQVAYECRLFKRLKKTQLLYDAARHATKKPAGADFDTF